MNSGTCATPSLLRPAVSVARDTRDMLLLHMPMRAKPRRSIRRTRAPLASLCADDSDRGKKKLKKIVKNYLNLGKLTFVLIWKIFVMNRVVVDLKLQEQIVNLAALLKVMIWISDSPKIPRQRQMCLQQELELLIKMN
jgi:hypothetical protein